MSTDDRTVSDTTLSSELAAVAVATGMTGDELAEIGDQRVPARVQLPACARVSARGCGAGLAPLGGDGRAP